MTFNDLAKAHVRTIVPAIVGLVITLALRAGVDLHGYAPFITTAVTAIYYSAAKCAEHYLDPRFGWLLGVAAAPQYVHQAKGRRKLTAHKQAGHVDLIAVLIVVLIVVVLLVAVGAFR